MHISPKVRRQRNFAIAKRKFGPLTAQTHHFRPAIYHLINSSCPSHGRCLVARLPVLPARYGKLSGRAARFARFAE